MHYTKLLFLLLIDQILHIKDPRAGWLVNETTVDSIVRTVGVTRESVIDSVRQNKCDDISALYHMIEYNLRDLEREMLQAVVTMLPPSSPTSKSPFFNMGCSSASSSVTSTVNAAGPLDSAKGTVRTISSTSTDLPQKNSYEVISNER